MERQHRHAVLSVHRSWELLLDELDQGAEAALRVDEGHRGAAAAGARGLVDRGGARRHHGGEGGCAVVDAVPDARVPELPEVGEVLADLGVGEPEALAELREPGLYFALMRRVVGEEMGVKAAGGVRDLEGLKAMVEAGASRVGASAGVKIVQQSAGKTVSAAAPSGY